LHIFDILCVWGFGNVYYNTCWGGNVKREA
jgi:hypothetical protein